MSISDREDWVFSHQTRTSLLSSISGSLLLSIPWGLITGQKVAVIVGAVVSSAIAGFIVSMIAFRWLTEREKWSRLGDELDDG